MNASTLKIKNRDDYIKFTFEDWVNNRNKKLKIPKWTIGTSGSIQWVKLSQWLNPTYLRKKQKHITVRAYSKRNMKSITALVWMTYLASFMTSVMRNTVITMSTRRCTTQLNQRTQLARPIIFIVSFIRLAFSPTSSWGGVRC